MKSRDWTQLKKLPSTASGDEEVKWVVPERFFDVLPQVLNDAPPLPGEEALCEDTRGAGRCGKRPQDQGGADQSGHRCRQGIGRSAFRVSQFRPAASAQLEQRKATALS